MFSVHMAATIERHIFGPKKPSFFAKHHSLSPECSGERLGSGKPLFEMCCFYMDIARIRGV